MGTEVSWIAAQIREGYSRGPSEGTRIMSGFYADELHVSHVPSAPGDGLRKAEEFVAELEAHVVAFARLAPDFAIQFETSTTEDQIVLAGALTGTWAKDGSPFRQELRAVLTLEHGRITRQADEHSPVAIELGVSLE